MNYFKYMFKIVCCSMIILCLTACTKLDENELKDDATQVQTSESGGTEMHDTAQENEPVSSADEIGKDERIDSAANTVLDNTTGFGDEDNALLEAEVKKNSASDNTNHTPDVDQESPSNINDDNSRTAENRDNGEDDKPKPEVDNDEHNNSDESEPSEDVSPTPTPEENGVNRDENGDENGDILLPEVP